MKNNNIKITKECYDKTALVELEYYGQMSKSTREELLEYALIEKNAKNRAYSFILRMGLFEEWEYFFHNGIIKDSADK